MTTPADTVRRRVVSLEEKIAFLRRSGSYAIATRHVTTIETHMSWVFLTGPYVYKLKKPVQLDFLDFRTVESRRQDCHAEVHLNRRLAPDVYLGVAPLTLETDGTLALAGQGETIDWLVLMRQLPTERLLDVMIRRRSATEAEVRPALELLARFYRDAEPAERDPDAFVERLAQSIRENRVALLRVDHDLPRPAVESVGARLLQMVADAAGALRSRVREGRIVEGHGDLRPEHVCLDDPPVIIDCIEFNRQFRIVDPADELSFLAMECERLGAGWIGDLAFTVYESETGDAGARELARLYMAHRAFLRANWPSGTRSMTALQHAIGQCGSIAPGSICCAPSVRSTELDDASDQGSGRAALVLSGPSEAPSSERSIRDGASLSHQPDAARSLEWGAFPVAVEGTTGSHSDGGPAPRPLLMEDHPEPTGC